MKQTGLFFKYLGNNHNNLYQERINALSGDIQAASEDKVRDLEKKVRQLKRDKEKLLDLGLRNRQDLTPAFENVNAEESRNCRNGIKGRQSYSQGVVWRW